MRILVRVKSRSRRLGVTKVDMPAGQAGATHFIVAVAEPPIEGRANKAVIDALAEYFSVSPSRIMLVMGATAREKTFDIEV